MPSQGCAALRYVLSRRLACKDRREESLRRQRRVKMLNSLVAVHGVSSLLLLALKPVGGIRLSPGCRVAEAVVTGTVRRPGCSATLSSGGQLLVAECVHCATWRLQLISHDFSWESPSLHVNYFREIMVRTFGSSGP